jgi:hypothetical protein
MIQDGVEDLFDRSPRAMIELAVKNKIARHEALVLLVKSGLPGIDMAERLSVYRQAVMELDIADALKPIRSRRIRAETAIDKILM